MSNLVSSASLAGGPGVAIAAAAGITTLAALAYLGNFVQPGGQVLVPDLTRGTSYADQARQNLMIKVYGPQDGNTIWNNEFSGRSIEVDLRQRYP